VNSWNFTGRLGRDAELKTPNGKPLLSFAVAVESGWGDNKKTTWVECTLFGKRAESLADHLLKGSTVGISGEHGVREYNGKTITTCNVQDVTLLGGKPAQSAPRPVPAPKPKEPESSGAPFQDDEIPF